jgi:5-methylcytosine-specific restriction endonuclease McrA
MVERKQVLKSKVFDYWMNTDKGQKRVNSIIQKTGVSPSFICADHDFPECFACGSPMQSFSTRKDGMKYWRDLWNKTKLEVAHIIPHSRGGESIPSNLVLLCRDCHRDNPDSLNETFFWKWLCNRPSWTTRRLQAMQEVPLSKDQMNNLMQTLGSIEDIEERFKQIGDLVEESWTAVDPVLVQGKYSAGSIAEMIHYMADNLIKQT